MRRAGMSGRTLALLVRHACASRTRPALELQPTERDAQACHPSTDGPPLDVAIGWLSAFAAITLSPPSKPARHQEVQVTIHAPFPRRVSQLHGRLAAVSRSEL